MNAGVLKQNIRIASRITGVQMRIKRDVLEPDDPHFQHAVNCLHIVQHLFADRAVNRNKSNSLAACLPTKLKVCNINFIVAQYGAHFANNAWPVNIPEVNKRAFRDDIKVETVKEHHSPGFVRKYRAGNGFSSWSVRRANTIRSLNLSNWSVFVSATSICLSFAR